MRHLLSSLVLLVTMVCSPGLVHASGLGKFVQGAGTSKVRKCNSVSPPPEGALYRLRASAMFGLSRWPSQIDGSPGFYLDGGYRLLSRTAGCTSRSGLFGGRNWSWHSLIVGLDSELDVADPSASSVGAMLAWDVRRESKGWLAEVMNVLPVGIGLTAGPYWRADEPGVGASVILRAILDVRYAVKYEFDRGWGWSLHVGMVDPHIFFYRLFTTDFD